MTDKKEKSMKKLIVMLAVFFFTTPAFAGSHLVIGVDGSQAMVHDTGTGTHIVHKLYTPPKVYPGIPGSQKKLFP